MSRIFTKYLFTLLGVLLWQVYLHADEPKKEIGLEAKILQTLYILQYSTPLTASHEVYEAGLALNKLLFSFASDEYKTGESGVLWQTSSGLEGYFSNLAKKSDEFSQGQKNATAAIKLLDQAYPIPTEHVAAGRADLSYDSPINFFSYFVEDKNLGNGNVFKGISLLGAVGHEETILYAHTNLFALHSLGPMVEVRREEIDKAKNLVHECHQVFGPAKSEYYDPADSPLKCSQVGGAFNYHMVGAMFLGCELTKKGFSVKPISTLAVTIMKRAMAHFSRVSDKTVYFDRFWEKRQKVRFGTYINLDLAPDLTELSGLMYKAFTAYNWLSDDAFTLLDLGYNEEGLKNSQAKFEAMNKKPNWPQSWNPQRLSEAMANLDYVLGMMEYDTAMHRVGGVFGSQVCKAYKEKVKPKGLSVDADKLYDLGFFSPHDTEEQVRERTTWPYRRIKSAFSELQQRLSAEGYEKFDF